MSKPKMMASTIPFSGFYESIHSHNLDRAVEQIAQDDSGDAVPLFDEDGEEFELWANLDWRKAQNAYAKWYAEQFAYYFKAETKIDLGLIFDEMTSPREYNFTTDRIFVNVRQSAVLAAYKLVDKTKLDSLIRARFTSYDGFSSYYDNSLSAWLEDRPVKEWDHNQVGTLLACLVPDLNEYDLIEDMDSNGDLSNMVWGAMNPDAIQIVNEYDKKRHAQEYFQLHQMSLPVA